MKSKGVLLNTGGDMVVNVVRDRTGKIAGGLVIGDVTQQNTALLIRLEAGEIKTAPTVGCGIQSFINSHETLLLKHRMREQLEADGLRVEYLKLTITGNDKAEIQIHANY